MTFDPKNTVHKTKLYRAIVAAAELSNQRFDDFLQIPFSPPWSLAANYRRNMQRGNYSATRAKVLHDFLRDHHFAVAHKTASDIFPETVEMQWRRVLDEKAIGSKLTIKLVPSGFGVLERRSRLITAEYTLKLGQEFVFELDSEHAGHATILQGIRGQWLPLDVGHDGSTVVPVVLGANIFPCLKDGESDPIRESHDAGMHEFICIVSTIPGIPTEIEQLVTWVGEKECGLHRVSVRFVM